ncbi:MAG: PQQ-binding-like beta-propeller repeat protein, partial [Muribaculaceae bacterium]|nr:PQQ-binding-like beta-propeller repeat protein [Muribaculaceae bacterium]
VFAVGMGNQVVVFDRNAAMRSADAVVVINSVQGSVWDVDFIQDRLLVTSGSPVDASAEVSIECFDASMQRVWEATDSVYGVYATSTAAPVKAQVIDIVTDDVDTLVLATMGAFVNAYDLQDGSVTHVMQQSAPILTAGIMSHDGKQAIAGCTSTGSLFVSDLQAADGAGEADSLRTLQLPYGIDDAHVIQGDEGFVGIAVWTSKPSSYRMFSPKTLLNPQSLEHKSDLSSTDLHVYQQVIVSTTGELIEGFDHNTFDRKWSIGLSSLGMMPVGEPDIFDRGSSLIVCNQAADVEEGLKVVELSCEDGMSKGQWVLDEEILSANPADVAFADIVSWEDGNRTILFATGNEGMVVNLDTRTVVSRFKAEREATLRKAWACGNSVITYQTIGVHGLFAAYQTASGAKISGPLTRQSAYEVSGSLVVSLSDDRASIVVKCSDGIVRAYSTADCSLAWQSSSSTRRAQFVSYVSPTQVLLQDISGMCTVLDAITGGVSQESDTRLPQIKSCTFDEDAQLVVATYENDGDVPRGLVAIALEDARFGPVSLVRHGLAISEDGKRVLCYLPWLEDHVVYPRYGIEELIERGYEELATYEIAS